MSNIQRKIIKINAPQFEWKNVPLLIEANNEQVQKKIIEFARLISQEYHIITSEQRKKIHLVAVLLNNFVNHLGVLSEDILNKHDLKLDLLLPLLDKTIEQSDFIYIYLNNSLSWSLHG